MKSLSDYPNLKLTSFINKVLKGIFPEKISILFRKGQQIQAPDKGEGVFYIKKGKVKLYKSSDTGKDKMVGIFNSGAVIGNVDFNNMLLFGTATALMDSEILFIPREIICEVMKSTLL